MNKPTVEDIAIEILDYDRHAGEDFDASELSEIIHAIFSQSTHITREALIERGFVQTPFESDKNYFAEEFNYAGDGFNIFVHMGHFDLVSLSVKESPHKETTCQTLEDIDQLINLFIS